LAEEREFATKWRSSISGDIWTLDIEPLRLENALHLMLNLGLIITSGINSERVIDA